MTKFFFTLAYCLLATTLSAADFTLKPAAQVTGPIVRLGDVCHIESGDAHEQVKLAALELGPAPTAGGAKFWRQREVQDRLQLLGYNLTEHRFGGSPLTTIDAAAPKTAPVTR